MGWTLRAIADELGVTFCRVDYWLQPERRRSQALAYKHRRGLVLRPECQTDVGQTMSERGGIVGHMPTPSDSSERITLRIPSSLADALRATAEREERTVSAEVRHVLRQHIGDRAEQLEPAS